MSEGSLSFTRIIDLPNCKSVNLSSLTDHLANSEGILHFNRVCIYER